MVKVRNVGLDTPALYKVDEEKSRIYMEDVSGITVKEYLYKNNDNSELAALIGKHLAQLHDLGIIHGDLTTSNLMLREGDISKLVFIDFGLSFHSKNDEDKAVDLYVLERALISTHNKVIIETYEKSSKYGKEVMKKLEKVRKRGRKRDMIG